MIKLCLLELIGYGGQISVQDSYIRVHFVNKLSVVNVD